MVPFSLVEGALPTVSSQKAHIQVAESMMLPGEGRVTLPLFRCTKQRGAKEQEDMTTSRELALGRRYDLHIAGYGNGGYIVTFQRLIGGRRWFHYAIKFNMGRVTTSVHRLDDDDYWQLIHAWRIDRDGTGTAVPASDWWML
jgi:hypothetical protein